MRGMFRNESYPQVIYIMKKIAIFLVVVAAAALYIPYAEAAVTVSRSTSGFYGTANFTLTINSNGTSDLGNVDCIAPWIEFWVPSMSSTQMLWYPDEVLSHGGTPYAVSNMPASTSMVFTFTAVPYGIFNRLVLFGYDKDDPGTACEDSVAGFNETYTYYYPPETFNQDNAGSEFIWFSSLDEPTGGSTTTATSTFPTSLTITNPTQDVSSGLILFLATFFGLLYYFKRH